MDERLSSLSLGCISKPRQTVPFASNSLPPCQLISPSSCLGSFISLLERSHISSLGHSPSFPPGTKVHSLCIPTVSFSSLLQGSYSLQGDLLLRWFSFMCLTCPSLQAIFQFPIIFILLYIFLTLLHRMWDLSSPRGMNPGPPKWRDRVLTTGLSGKSPDNFYTSMKMQLYTIKEYMFMLSFTKYSIKPKNK